MYILGFQYFQYGTVCSRSCCSHLEQLAAISSQKIGDKACEVMPVEMVGICSQRQEKHPPLHVAKGGRPVDVTDKAFWQACV